MFTICGTGHRPGSLGGYDPHIYLRLIELATEALEKYKPDVVISGMALGWDQALAEAGINLGINTVGAIPCLGQESRWPKSSQDRYYDIMYSLTDYEILEERYTAECMQSRNIWMVDRSDSVLALWNGQRGGTYNCVKYAQAKGVPVINLWSSWAKYR